MRLTPSTQIWERQERMIEFVRSHPITFLNAGTGTGKTLAMLATIAFEDYQRSIALTIKPVLRSVWARDTHKFIEGLRVIPLDKGTSKDKRKMIEATYDDPEPTIYVVNYETARMLDLEDFEWDFAVADESHKLKSHNSSQSIELAWSLRDVEHKVAMTGTAWEDRPTDVFGQVRFLEPGRRVRKDVLTSKRFGSWSEFFERYVKYRTVDNIKIPVKYINQDELAEKISDIYLHIERPQGTDVQHIIRYVDLKPSHMKEYLKFEKTSVFKSDGNRVLADNPLVLALRLHQFACGFYKPENKDELAEVKNGDAKLEALMGIAEELGDEPFVVFTRFQEDVNRISAALKRLGILSLRLTGERDEHEEWQDGKAQALIANIAAGSAGVSLTRACYGIYYSTGHSATDFVQSLGRIDRPPQDRPVTLYHLLAFDTVDEDIHDALMGKGERAENLLNRVLERA